MAQGLISKKHLIDIAEAIRVKTGSQTTLTPAEMATAISNITGGSGTIVKSTNTDVGLITDTLLDSICNALRAKLGTQDTFSPSEIADAILTISGGGGTIVPWSTGTDAEIAAMIQAAHNGDIDLQTDGGWAVGDVRRITVGAFTGGYGESEPQQDVDIVITSFDEYMSCGNVLQFDFKNGLSTALHMNGSETTSAGYGGCLMKATTLPALINALPSWLKTSLVEFPVSAYSGDIYSNVVTVQGNKLALRSLAEINGGSSDGIQLPYYSSQGNRTKKQGVSGSNGVWFTRTPATGTKWQGINTSGAGSDWYSFSTNRLTAPFGCL